jgi:CRP-like cAMP-binding protein/CheY-like chemotaxis protein
MSNNRILQSLREHEQLSMIPHLETAKLSQNDAIHRAGDPLNHIYFPESGLVSLLVVGQDGRAVETGIVGREGLIGGEVILGAPASPADVIVQVEGVALRAPTAQVLDALQGSHELRQQVGQHLNFLIVQARQNILCHALHSIEARLCRWLLQASDRLESTMIGVTQETCARLFGVQRTSLSMVAHGLQMEGMIMTRRGKIELLDLPALRARACECYARLGPQLDFVQGEAVTGLKGTASSELIPPRVQQGTILVIDDDAVFGYAARRYFENSGYRVILAESSTQAIELVRSTRFDVVITDIRLGRGEPDGLELAALIKNKMPKVPVLFVTAYPELLGGRPLPGDQVFLKPVEVSQLGRAVKARLAA